MNPISHWPTQERPREKLLKLGAAALSDSELLAIFLRTGVRGKTAVDLGRDLLQEFGNLRNIITSDLERFCRARGLGVAKYTQLQAVLEIAHRYFKNSLQQQDALLNSQDTKRFLATRLQHRQQEIFACLFLNSAHHIIHFAEIFFGTINHTAVHPREVVKLALAHNAAAVIFAHNHPSGVSEPSQADQHITKQLQHALAFIDVRVLDHMVIGNGEITSFSEKGLL